MRANIRQHRKKDGLYGFRLKRVKCYSLLQQPGPKSSNFFKIELIYKAKKVLSSSVHYLS